MKEINTVFGDEKEAIGDGGVRGDVARGTAPVEGM